MKRVVSSSEQAISTMEGVITAGELAPGTLLTETDLADRLGMSRTPVREAIRHLVATGLLERESSHNLRVSPFTIEDAIEVLYIREELECLALRLGAARIPQQKLRRLRKVLASADRDAPQRADGHITRRLQEATAVHDLIMSAPRSPVLRQMTRFLEPHAVRERYFTSQIWRLALERDRITGQQHREHLGIVDALIAGKYPRAEQLLRQHIRRVREMILERFDARARSYGPPATAGLGGGARRIRRRVRR